MSDVKKLYYALLSHGYTSEDLGDENTFTSAMSDANNRKELYDGAKANGLDLGDYDEYDKRLTQQAQAASTPNVSVENNTPKQDYIEGFGEGVKQGKQQLGAGLKYAGGEALDFISETAMDNANALSALEQMQADGKDVIEETKVDAKSVLLPLIGHSGPVIDTIMRVFGKKNPIAKANDEVATDRTIRRVLKEVGGDVEAAKNLLAERANEKTTADIWRDEAAAKMNEAKPTKGFGAWAGNMIPQMAGTVAGLGLSAVTKSPIPAQILGLGQMGALTTSTAGSSMKEARDAGATNGEVWATGIADAAIELATEAIPFKGYISPLVKQMKAKTAKAMTDAVLDAKSPARKELQDLLRRANEQLGGKLFTKENAAKYLDDVMKEGLSEFTAEALQTITPIIYAEPENYPTFWDALKNGWEGLKGGVFMGSVLGGASQAAVNKAQRDRRKEQGFVDVAEVKFSDDDTGIAEVISYDPKNDVATILYNGEVMPLESASQNIGTTQRFSFEEFDLGQIEMEQAESYENGSNLETPQEKNDAYNMYKHQADEMRRIFGLDSDADVDAFIGDDPYSFAMAKRNENPDDGQAVLNYLNAKATMDGLYDQVNDTIDQQIEQSNKIIDSRKNIDDAMIHPATMRLNDRKVYIISGRVKNLEDGTIDTANSDKSIIIMDAETGNREFTTATDIKQADAPIDAEQEKMLAAETITNTISDQAEIDIEGVLPFNVGDPYTILDDQGIQHTVTIVADNGDGTVQMRMDNEQQDTTAKKDDVQAMFEAYNLNRLNTVVTAKKEQETKVAESSIIPTSEQAVEQVEPKPRIPLDEQGEPMYEAAPVYDTWTELLELNEGNEEEAIDTANTMRENAQAELDKAMEAPKVKGKTVPEIQAAKAQQKALIKQAQDKLNYWTEVANYRDAQLELMKRAEQRATIAKAQAASQEKGRYSEENAALGAPIDFRDYVMRSIATGGVRFVWGDSTTGTRGLAAHIGLKSDAERKSRIWMLSNDNGLYPEEAAEQLLTSYTEEIGYTPNIDTMDALSEILDVVGSYSTPSSMFEAAQERHAENEQAQAQDEEDAVFYGMRAEAEQNGMTVEDWILYQDMMQEYILPIYEENYEQIIATFVESAQNEEILNQNNNERGRSNDDVQQSVHREGGLPDGGETGIGVLQAEQVDDGIGDSRSAEAGQGSDVQAVEQSIDDIPASEVFGGTEVSESPSLLDVVRTLYTKGKTVASKLFSMKFFDVTDTPTFMKELGLRGDKFTIKYGVISRHIGKDNSHNLSEKDWEQLPLAIQTPFAISRLTDKDNSYRIYTTLQTEGGEYIVVGADVKSAGREIEVNSISTVFGRRGNANLSQNQEVIYRSETITPEQSSLLKRPNFAQYPTAQELSSESKDNTNNRNIQKLAEKSEGQFTIEPSTYTTKRGKELKMHLVKFATPLSKEQQRAAKELAKAEKGWYDAKQGGFMMRTEDGAKRLADTILRNDSAISDAQPISIDDVKSINDGDVSFVEPKTSKKKNANTPIWQYSVSVDKQTGETILTRDDISGEMPISDDWHYWAESPEEMLGILQNPHNKMQDILDAVGVTLENKIKTRELNRKVEEERKREYEALRGNGYNGYKIGDEVMYKGKKAKIHDLEEFGEHRPVLDTGLAPVLYEVAEWSDIQSEDAVHKTIFSSAFKDLVSEDGKYNIRITKVDGAKRIVTADLNTANIGGEGLELSFEEMANILNSGNWQEKTTPQPTNPSGNRLVTDERYAELRERMRKKLGGQMNIGIDPEILAIGTEMAVYHLEKGARKFAEYAKAMIADLGDAIRPYLKAFYNGARDLPEVENSEIAADMTPYDEVQNFDVANFDKSESNAIATAETVVKEQEVSKQVDVATEKIKNNRNKTRKTKNKSVSSQEMMDLFGESNASQNNTTDNDLRRDDAVRTEGLPADGDRDTRGGRTEGDNTEVWQEGERPDRRGDSRDEGVGSEVSQSDRRPVGRIQGITEKKNTRNNHTERGAVTAPASVDARIDANIKAIELSQQLIANDEQATPEQMAILRKFSGWGGLGKAFSGTTRATRILQELLGVDAYQEAVMSANSAYYTPTEVIDTLWDVARQMGFEGGNILEGSAGIGNILGQMPTDISERSDIRAIEIDSTAGNILSLLYPDAQVDIQGFEQTHIPNGSIDLTITNVPFVTGLRVNDTSGDKDLSKKFHNIHDFCIAKNVRKLREGGIGIFITSNGTLDNSKKLREWVTNQGNADFVGAFRLNNKTFIGTGVTSDIIVVRKRVNGQVSPNAIDVSDVSGVRTAQFDTGETRKVKGVETPVIKPLSMDYNKYFIDHPDNMAGVMRFGFEEGDTYRPTSKGLYPAEGKDQTQMLNDFVKSFSSEAQIARLDSAIQADEEMQKLLDGKKLGEVFVKGNRLYITDSDGVHLLDVNANKVKGHTKVECFNAYTAIKTAVKDTLDYQMQNDSNDGLKPLLDKLNKAYDDFVKTYGHFNKNTAIAFLRNDVDFANIISLEKYEELGDGNGGRVQKFEKSDIFKGRVIEKETEPRPTNIKDGIVASIFKFGRIDIPYISGQLQQNDTDVKAEIIKSGYGFENPATREVEVSFQYLSGNIREKLRLAEDNNDNGQYDKNIKALQDVMPMDIPAHLIDFTLGSSWIDPKLYDEYVKDRTDIDVKFTSVGGTWFMDAPQYGLSKEKNRAMGVVSTMLHKTIMGHELIEAAIQNRTINVSQTRKKWDGTTETITDKEATQACATKIDEIRQDFKDWARQKMQSDPEMSARVERVYNDTFNNYVPISIPNDFVPKYFGGASHKFEMRPHQGKAIVRGTMQPLLLAHEVGTGKTFTLISIAMEMRRLGTARKPMIVVQNATVGQFVESAKELYPNAKILTLEESDRSAEGRKNFYAKIRYNDWDMIVVPQSTFEFIPDSEERQMAYIQDKIDEKMMVLQQMKEADANGNNLITRQAEKEIDELETQLAVLTNRSSQKRTASEEKKRAIALQNAEVRAAEMLDRRTDDVENFDDMGIDALLIDEAHEYKHLGFATAMQRGVKGVDPSYSKKSQGVYLKTQAVLEKNNGRNVIFATGTPISNTAAEIWTFMRYLMPADTMVDYGIYYFDDFVRNFGNIQQMLEFTTSGKFKESNRFAGYVNLPELIRIWSGVSDTMLTKDAEGVNDKIPDIEGGKANDIYLPQTRALRGIMKYVKAQLEAFDKMSGKQKKENSHIPLTMYGIAKAAAVDARLVQEDAEDDVNSKTNEAVRQALRSLRDTDDYKGTIAIFADNYQNKYSGFNIYEDIKSKLVEQGVSPNEVVVIKPGMTIKKKLEIFDKVNKGEIRVIMGSTFTLGTGVNIQERLHTVIHLDAPNRPMDYTQRNGRILRQGNIHKTMNKPVRVLRFGVEDSLDVTAYQRLKTKGAIADSIMNGKQMMANSMVNRVLEEEEDVFGDTVAQLSGSEYAMLKNNAEKNVRKYESRRKQWEADQTYIHNAKPRLEKRVQSAEQSIDEQKGYLDDIRKEYKYGKFKSIIIGKNSYTSIDGMADFIKEYNKTILDEQKQLKDGALSGTQTRLLPIKIDGYTFNVTTTIEKEVNQSGGQLFSEAHRKMVYSCPELGLENIPVKQALLRNAIDDIVENVITGKDYAENIETLERIVENNRAELKQMQAREGKPFEFGDELEKAKSQYLEYSELMKKEMEEKEAKYAEMDATVEAADSLNNAEEDEEIHFRLSNKAQTKLEGWYDDIAQRYNIQDNIIVAPSREQFEQMLLDNGVAQERLYGYDLAAYIPESETFIINGEDIKDNIEAERAIFHEVWHKLTREVVTLPHLKWIANNISANRLASINDAFWSDRYESPIAIIDELISSSIEFYIEAEVDINGEPKSAFEAYLEGNISLAEATVLAKSKMSEEAKVFSDIWDKVFFETKRNLIAYKSQYYGKEQDTVSRRGEEGTQASTKQVLEDRPLQANRNRTGEGRTAATRAEQRQRAIVAEATELASSLGVKLNVIEDVNEIIDSNIDNQRKKRDSKAWYSETTGKVYFVLPNAESVADAQQSVLHEVVAHKGLRDVVGRENFNQFLSKIYFSAPIDVRRKIVDLAKNNSWNMRDAIEEYLSSLAEKGFDSRENRTFWQKVRDLFMDMLREAKIAIGYNITDNDMRYMLWRTYQKQKSQGAMAVAEDVLMQQKLGVGNFRTRPMTGKVLFRSQPTTPSTGEARKLYDNAVRRYTKDNNVKRTENLLHHLREAYQDSMLSVKALMDAILKETGNKLRASDDVYRAENQLSSKNKAEIEKWERDFVKPLQLEILSLIKEGASYNDIVEYLLAKHGLERNLEFSRREDEDNGKVWDGFVKRDYSGLTELTGEAEMFTEAAQQIVDEFEQQYSTDVLWGKINAATKESLRKSYDSGMMNKETYDKVSKMFKYYIPLRGWDNNVAADQYEYMANKGMKILPALKTARGRKSRADDPIATLFSIGESSIIQGNRNLMKLKFLNLAQNNPTSLLTVSEQWYEQNADGTWRPSNPEIPQDASADEVDAIIKAHEEKMEALGDKATKKRQGLNLDLHTTYWEREEHAVNVKRNGKEYKIFVNGNPVAAQAINGFTNPDAKDGELKKAAMWVKNFMARAFTSKNPAFIFTNLGRDLIWAGTSVAIKENGNYVRQYTKNIGEAMLTAQLPRLISKWESGTLDMNVPLERYFNEFITNGGETGFTQLNTVDDYKRNIERFIKEAQGGTVTNAKKTWRWIWDNVEFLNRSAEDTTRFMVYMTSRQMGRSISESVANAKDITVNFNKKGRGGFGATTMNFAYIFFNATIQSLANFGKLIANHPKKTAAALTIFASTGFIAPMVFLTLQAMFSDDDDEPTYWDLPEWVRRNNIVIWVGGSGYITIPLPHELRPFYGMGELAFSTLTGKEDPEIAIRKAVEGFASLMPFDYTGNAGNVLVNFTPTIAQPLSQLVVNKDYFGTPIYRKTAFNELDPEWTKAYKSTNQYLVDATAFINELTGGDDVKSGMIDINPAVVEHIFEGYFGGMGRTINRFAKTLSMFWDEDAREWRNVPVLSSFYQESDERTSGSQINREYYNALTEAKQTEHYYRGYKKRANMGVAEYAEKLNKLVNSDVFKRYQKINSYQKAITKLNEALEQADKTDRELIETRIMNLKVDMLEELDLLNNK